MKKRIYCLVSAIVLLCMSICPAFATASDEWVLYPEAQKITQGENTYVPVDSYFLSFTDENQSWDYNALTFVDPKVEEEYAGSYLYVTEGMEDIAIEVGIYKNGEYNDYLLYVEEAYYDEFMQLKEGNANSYLSYNDYAMSVSLSPEEYKSWCESNPSEMTANELDDYHWYYIYGCISNNAFGYECGNIYHDVFTDELYLLIYDENGDPYNASGNTVFTVYELEDGALKNKLIECYDDMPADDLDWLVAEESSSTVSGVFSAIVFGVIPLAVVIFAVVMLIVMKDRKYRRPFIFLLSGATATLVSCIILFAILV